MKRDRGSLLELLDNEYSKHGLFSYQNSKGIYSNFDSKNNGFNYLT